MFRKSKYILNRTNLQFEQVKLSSKEKILRSLLWLALSGVLTIIYISIFKSLLGSPKEKFLNQQLDEIKLNYSLVAKQLDRSMSILNDLCLSDDIRYRPILDMDLLPETYRKVGVGGIDRYRTLTGFINSDILISSRSKLDMISNMANVQKESFKLVTDMASDWKIKMEHLPMISPVNVKYRLGDRFMLRQRHPILGTPQMHNGQDFSVPTGTEVYATGNGTVIESGRSGGLGIYVVIDHGYGFRSIYGHLSRIITTKGAYIKRGDIVGLSGNTGLSTGPHLHYEVHEFGQPKNPLNYFNNDMNAEEYDKMIEVFASRYRLR